MGEVIYVSTLPGVEPALEAEDLPELYRALGATMNGAFRDWRKAIIVPEEPKLVAALGLKGARQLQVKNGGLRCLLLLSGV